jgi:hypothetical protein
MLHHPTWPYCQVIPSFHRSVRFRGHALAGPAPLYETGATQGLVLEFLRKRLIFNLLNSSGIPGSTIGQIMGD